MSTLGKILRWLVAGQLPAHVRAYLRVRLDARKLAASSLFDAAWYVAAYDDVAISGRSPALHYRLRGAAEGRRPGPHFDGDAYLASYPELRGSDANPLLHCLRHGDDRPGRIDPSTREPPLPRLPVDATGYRKWIAACDAMSLAEREAMEARISVMRWRPTFSIVLSGAATATGFRRSLDALQAQAYPEWEALLPQTDTIPLGTDRRIRHGAAADAIGDFMLFLTPAILPGATALFEMAVAAGADTELIYADEDQIDTDGQRHSPWFKPGWDPDLLAVQDFPGQACAWRRSRFETLRAVPTLGDPGVLTLDAARIRHVAAILFHRTEPPRGTRAITRIHHGVPSPEPLVSIIVPTRDRAHLLRKCADGVLNRTAYRNIELLIVDNDSRAGRTHRLLRKLRHDPRVRILHHAGAFNWSAMNNAAASEARGEVLLLLNNDIEVIAPPGLRGDWLHELVGQALRPEVGAVGARLLYPDGRLQHAGITLGAGAASAHLMRHASAGEVPSCLGLEHVRGVAAVTGACMAMRRSVFEQVGGIEAEHLAQTHNDIDLCLRLRSHGYRILVTPHATLVHHEAATRGADASAAQCRRTAGERAYLTRRWGELAQADPYLNPNLTVVADRLAFAPPLPRDWAVSSPSPSRSSRAHPRLA